MVAPNGQQVGNLLADLPHRAATRKVLTRSLAILGERGKPSDIVESQARKYGGQQSAAIARWIEEQLSRHGESVWVGRESSPIVLAAVAEHLAHEKDSSVIWAFGMIDPWECDGGRDLLFDAWDEHIVSWAVDEMLATVNAEAEQDRILRDDMAQSDKFIPRDAFGFKRPLRMLHDIRHSRPDLLYLDLRGSVRNLIGWILELDPTRLPDLIYDGQHPVVAALASSEAGRIAHEGTPDSLLAWIQSGSSELLIGAGIYESLGVAAALRNEQHRWKYDPSHSARNALRPRDMDFDAEVSTVLSSMVDRIAGLDGGRAFRWLGEILSEVEYLYPGSEWQDEDVKTIVSRAEQAVARLSAETEAFESGMEALVEGLRTPPRTTTTRHLENIARLLVTDHPGRAERLRHAFLDDYAEQVASARARHFYVGSGGHGQVWTQRLGEASGQLALTKGPEHIVRHFERQLSRLHLTIWDLEEDDAQFMTDASIAQHLFTVIAVGASQAYEGNPQVARSLAEWMVDAYWPRQEVMARTYVVGDHVSWGPPTVMAAMLQSHPYGESRAADLLSARHVPPLAVATVALHATDEDIKAAASEEVVERFEDRLSLGPEQAREWSRVFDDMGDPERGLRALWHVIMDDERRAFEGDHLAGLRFALQLLGEPLGDGEKKVRAFTTEELRETALMCHSRLAASAVRRTEEVMELEEAMRDLGLLRGAGHVRG